MVQPDATKAATLMHVETYFQMNYETGNLDYGVKISDQVDKSTYFDS